MSKFLVAKVKNVLSGDTVVLVPLKTTQIPVPERILTLSYVRSNGSFMAKEYLRKLLIGKEIKFKVLYKVPATGKEFGDIQSPTFNSLIEHLVEKGMVKVKENNADDDDDFIQHLVDIERRAEATDQGTWNANDNGEVELVDLDDFAIEKSRKTPITVIVEKVISGDRVVARIIVNKHKHIVTSLVLAGIRTPRTDDTTQSTLQKKIALEAKQFVEDKLLTTTATIKVSIIGETQSGLPVAVFYHESGNDIHEKLLEKGFAEIVDWQSSMIGSQSMLKLRKAEQTAKALGKGLFSTSKAPNASNTTPSSSATLRQGATIEGVQILNVISADTFGIKLPSGEEATVQLASIRAPKSSDTTVTSNSKVQQALVNSAREFARQKAIGKTGTCYVVGLRTFHPAINSSQKPASKHTEGSRYLIDFKLNGLEDLAELIVKNGMATVIKHNKATANERSMNWDKLIELEEEQRQKGSRGVFYSGNDLTKVLTVGTRVIDASENSNKAKAFFNGLRQKDRISGYHVDFIPSINRVKLYNPKEGLKLTLVLGGLSNNKEGDAPEKGLKMMRNKYLQRNVEFDIYDKDKVGGFIGNLYANASSSYPVQVSLLEQGFVRVHDLAVTSNPFCAELVRAEESAKEGKKGLWANENSIHDISNQIEQMDLQGSKPKFFDIEVTEVDPLGIIYFHILDSETVAKFNSFKKDFQAFHLKLSSASSSSLDFPSNLTRAPKKGELVSAKFSDNGKYYRAKVLAFDKSSSLYEVKHLDFGNVDKVPLSALRLLPSQFSISKLPAFVHSTSLQNIKLPPASFEDYLSNALDALDEYTFDKKLVLSALPSKTGPTEYNSIIYDSQKSLKDSTYTINKQLVSDGWALVDSKSSSNTDKDYVNGLLEAELNAKSKHLGCWEFGNISFDEEDTYI
ncbi:uncharacterized protein PRCAT00004452001 [Priceomyces carsonii]|uniref:uncharacterized protein n=1 Tax=Priceomyces carsonii TaxID=28549 RepID=UPI002EDA4CFE|nr:unnamed protein product [Priceomyces carsonii]